MLLTHPALAQDILRGTLTMQRQFMRGFLGMGVC
jgi:hypothetical protein